MRRLKAFLIYLAMASLSTALAASPTKHDFEKCKKLAVSYLDFCLQGSENKCWEKSKASHKACRIKIMKSYQDMGPKRKAEENKLKLLNKMT